MDVKACKNYFQKGKKEKSIKFGVKKQEKEPKEQTLLDLDRLVSSPRFFFNGVLRLRKVWKRRLWFA